MAKRLHDRIEKHKDKSKKRKRTRVFTVDFRIHTPHTRGYLGGDGINTAVAMVSLAKVKGIDAIAITDYYSGVLIDEVRSAAEKKDIMIFPGVDLRCTLSSCNDVHLTCLFPEEFSSRDIESFLRILGVPSDVRGDETFTVGREFSEIVNAVEGTGGVVIPSRMDKTPQRISVIPILVEEFGFRTFDLAYLDSTSFFEKRWPKIKFNLFTFSSANSLAQIGSRTGTLNVRQLNFANIKEVFARSSSPV